MKNMREHNKTVDVVVERHAEMIQGPHNNAVVGVGEVSSKANANPDREVTYKDEQDNLLYF